MAITWSNRACGIEAFSRSVGWLVSTKLHQWWRQELWRTDPSLGGTFDAVVDQFRHHFIPDADANNLILQMRTWEKHDVGTTSRFTATSRRRSKSIKVPVLYMCRR